LVFTLWVAFQAATAHDFYVSGFGAMADDALHDAAVSSVVMLNSNGDWNWMKSHVKGNNFIFG
jgi:hypothetical protein